MGKNEHKRDIFGEIPIGSKNGKFHSAVLTTYTIDLLNFDKSIINTLRRKRICSINLLIDQSQMANTMEYISPLYMHGIGKKYSVTNIRSRGGIPS